MDQQEYDAFREQMKQWMLDNADIYDEFEEMMNSQSDVGVQQIMTQAMALVPGYGKLIRYKIDDIQDIWFETDEYDHNDTFCEYCIITPQYNTAISTIWEA